MQIKKFLTSLLVIPSLLSILAIGSFASIVIYPHETVKADPNGAAMMSDVRYAAEHWGYITDQVSKNRQNLFSFSTVVKTGFPTPFVDNHSTVFYVSFTTNTKIPAEIRSAANRYAVAYCYKGDVYVNKDYKWKTGGATPAECNLFASQKYYAFGPAVKHELGHVFGLPHSSNSNDLMYAETGYGWKNITITANDMLRANSWVNYKIVNGGYYYQNPFDGPGRKGM